MDAVTPFTSNGRGTFELRMRLGRLPYIRRASGTTDPKTFAAIQAMCRTLYRRKSRHDILREIAAGRLVAVEVYDAYLREDLDSVPIGGTDTAELHGAWTAWLQGLAPDDYSHSYIKDLEGSGRRLAGLPAPTKTPKVAAEPVPKGKRTPKPKAYQVADIPARLITLRSTMTPSAFNHLKAHAQSFARATLGRTHAVYVAITDLKNRAIPEGRAPLPRSVAELRALRETLGGGPGGAGDCAWSMAITGMGPKELWEDGWHLERDRTVITGQKRRGRRRIVPLAAVPIVPRISRKTFERRLADLGGDVQPYDFRRSYANYLVEAGIPPNRRRCYQGHGARTMDELYERPDIARWLAEDALALQAIGLTDGQTNSQTALPLRRA